MSGCLFFDIDGTLVDSEHGEIMPSSSCLEAIHKAQKNGYRCLISSGRNLGGLKEDVPGYEIIDYCLNGEKQGLWTVWTCFAEFSYSKALTIEVDDTEIQKFISKWENRISKKDNFYNQNLAELGIL